MYSIIKKMSINHLIDPNTQIKLDIACNSCNCESMKVFDKLEVKNFTLDAQNGDPIELSTLLTHGNGGERLTSNGDGSVSWVPGAGSSGVDYSGVLPVAINKLAIYGATDGLLIKDSSLNETDLLNTQTKANNNEFSISTLSLTKLNKSGDTMSGNLNMNSNDIKTVEAVYTNNLYSKVGLGNIKVNNGNLDFQNINGISNLNNLEVTTLSANNGISIGIIDDINLNNFDLNSVNEIKTNSIITNTSPDVNFLSPLDMNNNNITRVNNLSTNNLSVVSGGSITLQDDLNINNFDLLNINTATVSNIEGCQSINGLTPVGGLYSGISNGVVINQASGQTDLLPVSSVGSLSVPANAFQVGDAYHLVVAGIFPTESKADDITIDVKQDGTTIASINLDLEDFDVKSSNFELEMDFVVRATGVAGVIASNLDFSYNKKISKDFKGTRSTDITTVDTTTASSLSVLATVNGATSSIQSRLAYLRKQY